jgi:hypothetical protein
MPLTRVLSSPQNAVWPIPQSPFFRKCCSFTAIFLTFLFLTLRAVAAEANSLEDAARLLADRVVSIPNLHGPLRLEFNEGGGLAASPGTAWLESFRKELEARHFDVTDDSSVPVLRIAVTATPTQLILAVSARSVDHDEVRIVSLPRALIRPVNLPVAPLRIERQLIFESPELILDASSLWYGSEGGIELLAYRKGELTALQLDATGAVKQSIPLTAAAPHPSRDPHGELNVRGNEVDALLPGKVCTFTWTLGSEVKCRSAKPVWRGTTLLTPSCDPGGWKIVSDGRDWTAPETLQVVPDGAAREGSAAILSEFSGPVLNVNGEQNPASALVVTRNLCSGNYEVYRITLACGN